MCSVLSRHVANDVRDRTDLVEIGGRRVLRFGLVLKQKADFAFVAHCLLGGCERPFAIEGDGKHRAWKQHEVSDRHDEEHVIRDLRSRCFIVGRIRMIVHMPSVQWVASRRTKQPLTQAWTMSSERAAGNAIRRSKRPYGISKRCTGVV